MLCSSTSNSYRNYRGLWALPTIGASIVLHALRHSSEPKVHFKYGSINVIFDLE
jgi:hypothetical protein